MSGSESFLSPEVEAIFKKFSGLLENDREQNDTLPEPHRSQIKHGPNCDELPNAHGEFGRSPSNPIPTNGPLGEVIYLSRLRTKPARRWWRLGSRGPGSPIMFHRLGSQDGSIGSVDAYEVLSLDGNVRETLYLSMYHPRKSKKVPNGYTYATKLDPDNIIYGVNHTVQNFPQNLDAHIRKWQKEMWRIPLPVHRVREAINGSRFRPSVLSAEKNVDPMLLDKHGRDIPYNQPHHTPNKPRQEHLVNLPSRVSFPQQWKSEQAMALISSGQLEEGGELAYRAVKQDPSDWQAHYALGQFFRFSQDFPQACVALARAHELSPRHAPVLLALAVARQHNQEYEASAHAIKLALEIDPDYAVAYNTLAMTQKFVNRRRT